MMSEICFLAFAHIYHVPQVAHVHDHIQQFYNCQTGFMYVCIYVCIFFFNRHVIRGMELQDKEAQKD